MPRPSLTALRVRPRVALLATAALVLLPATHPLRAQGAAVAPPPQGLPALDARSRGAVVDSLAAQLAHAYVDADTARRIADVVKTRLRAGAYDTIVDPFRFADAVTADLRSVNGDLHLGLHWMPGGGGADGRPVVRGAAPAASAPRAGAAPWMAEARQRNYGLTRAEILPGNVGYLEIAGFIDGPGADSAVASALRFLERTDAVIIDLRRNGGGSGRMSHLVFSHFLGAKPMPTIHFVSRVSGESRTLESVADVPGPRRTDVPLFLLTSRRTASAAEEFSFVLANAGRATLVGDRTAGAGHMVEEFDVGGGFTAGISTARVTDPRTGREWERVGVRPDVSAPVEGALGVAHAAALRAIAAKSTNADRRHGLELTAEALEAKGRGVRVDPARLGAAVGTYESGLTIELVDGKLMARREHDPSPEELVPLGDGRFAIGGQQLQTRVTFDAGTPSPRLVVERPDGQRRTFARVSAPQQAGRGE